MRRRYLWIGRLYEVQRMHHTKERIKVVEVEGALASVRREISHYAAVYGQDGPVEAEIKKKPAPRARRKGKKS